MKILYSDAMDFTQHDK